MKLVECVPNFSEGRDPVTIDRIAKALSSVTGCQLLHVDSEHDTNRSVMTLMGEPEAVSEAAFEGIRTAVETIDLKKHRGTHPRFGAADVVPFVPWEGVEMDACITLAKNLATRCASLEIPVYLYGQATEDPQRRYLADLRRGGFEGLARQLSVLPPDRGPSAPHPTAGAIAIGAREVLVAWNITLKTTDLGLARRIARTLREFQAVTRDDEGRAVSRVNRGLPGLRSLGWHSARDGCVQVTSNITDWKQCPPHQVFEAVQALASQQGVRIRGSELVGMIPREALLIAGRHFGGETLGPDAAVAAAIDNLRLDRIVPFNPAERIIEARLKKRRTS